MTECEKTKEINLIDLTAVKQGVTKIAKMDALTVAAAHSLGKVYIIDSIRLKVKRIVEVKDVIIGISPYFILEDDCREDGEEIESYGII